MNCSPQLSRCALMPGWLEQGSHSDLEFQDVLKSPGILKVSWNVLENEKSPGKVLEFHVAISRAYVATATIVATVTLVSI